MNLIIPAKKHVVRFFFLLSQIISTRTCLKLLAYSAFRSRVALVDQTDYSFPVINFDFHPRLSPADNLLNEFA